MIIRVAFPKDSKHPERGFVEKEYSVDECECLEKSRTKAEFVDCICEQVVEQAARAYCRQMAGVVGGGSFDACVDLYITRQGERIRQNCEAQVEEWLMSVAEKYGGAS